MRQCLLRRGDFVSLRGTEKFSNDTVDRKIPSPVDRYLNINSMLIF